MKLLVKKLLNSKLSFYLRNTLAVKPLYYDLKGLNNCSVSDAFIWRTDSNFKTIFRFTDILKQFYKIENSYTELHFNDENNNYIKKVNFEKLNHTNELIIDKNFLNSEKNFGTFFIYHKSKQKLNINSIISNRCYVGYSKEKNFFSFVHGNTYAKYKDLFFDGDAKSDIVNTSFLKTQNYKIQKFFNNFDKNELIFSNPTTKKINFSINQNKYTLNSGCTIIIDINSINIVNIKSNCYFLRPLIFSYKNNYIDIHHS